MASLPAFEQVVRVSDLMSSFDGVWALCGGWTVDVWLGGQSRDHGDVDILVFRDDERAIFAHLDGWRLVAHDTPDAAHDERWDGRPLGYLEPGTQNAPVHLHGTHPDFDFKLEVLFNERGAGGWLLNRKPSISLSMDRAVRLSPAGLPTVVAAVLMFYKATAYRGVPGYPRQHDEADFFALLPHLEEGEHHWLHRAVSAICPEHAWLPELER